MSKNGLTAKEATRAAAVTGKAGHTAGPWKLKGWLVVRDRGTRYVIADVMTTADLSDAEKEANGRLCAAAPALLTALRDVIGIIDGNQQHTGAQFSRISEVTEARQAIARAEGRE